MDSVTRILTLILITFGVPGLLLAQPGDPAFDNPGFENESYGGDASALFGDAAWFGRYRPHFGYRYEAGDTIGRIGGLSSFDAFVPLREGIDNDWLLFIDARLLLDDDHHNLGSNVGVGARQYMPEIERTIGTYLYYDTRDAGYATFDQISGGIETLGDAWDARINWYVPIGQTRNQYATTLTNAGGSYQFIGHHLTSGTLTRYYQAAMKGVDMEAGTKFYSNGCMDFRAYAGWYHFQAKGSPQAWGWKSRIETRISNMVSLNLSVQNDRVFDTTVNFAVGIQWPSISGVQSGLRGGPRSHLTAADRLGERPERLRSIVVDNQEVVDPIGGLVIDPSTGNPYFFMHVATGGNSDGSYEDPYATLADAFADPRTQAGNVIVYDHRNGSETGDFTLASNTRVLSTGPTQLINSQFGQIQLPDSNSGVNPQITGSFTLNEGSVLSGFALSNSTGSSILANGVGNILVSNSTITNTSTAEGVFLQNLTGPVTFDQTTLDKTNGRGLSISGGSGDVTFTNSPISGDNTNRTVLITNTSGTIQLGQITSSNSSGDIDVRDSSGDVTIEELNSTDASSFSAGVTNSTGSFTLNGGTIVNPGFFGVALSNSNNITIRNTTIDNSVFDSIIAVNVTNFNFSNNTIDNAGSLGINISSSSGNGTISGNTIRSILTAFDNAIEVVTSNDINLDIDNNMISSALNISGNGIDVTIDGGNSNVNIRGNQITSIANAFGDAIKFTGNSTGTMNTTITGNTIENTLGAFGDAINVRYYNGSATTNIAMNTIDSDEPGSVFGTGVYLYLSTTGVTDTYIDQNVISDDNIAALFSDGIAVGINQGTDHDVFITNNLIAQTSGAFDDSIEILMSGIPNANARIQVNSNLLNGSSGAGGRALDVDVFSPKILCLEVMGNQADNAFDLFADTGATINVEDLPNLSINNNGTAVNQSGGGTIQKIADCFP